MLLFAGWLEEAQLHASNALDADLSHWGKQMSSKPRDWDSFRTGKQLCSLHGFPPPFTGHIFLPGLCCQGPGCVRPRLASLLLTLRGIHQCESLPKVLIRPL